MQRKNRGLREMTGLRKEEAATLRKRRKRSQGSRRRRPFAEREEEQKSGDLAVSKSAAAHLGLMSSSTSPSAALKPCTLMDSNKHVQSRR